MVVRLMKSTHLRRCLRSRRCDVPSGTPRSSSFRRLAPGHFWSACHSWRPRQTPSFATLPQPAVFFLVSLVSWYWRFCTSNQQPATSDQKPAP